MSGWGESREWEAGGRADLDADGEEMEDDGLDDADKDEQHDAENQPGLRQRCAPAHARGGVSWALSGAALGEPGREGARVARAP